MHRAADPLAKGLCRPPMFLMAPFDAMVVNAMLSVTLCLVVGEMLLLPVFAVPTHVVAVLICMGEPRAFELAHRYFVSLPHASARRVWKGVAFAPGRICSDG